MILVWTPLFWQVLCVGNLYNPDVRYSFNIPIEEQREQFVWDPSGSWLECSRLCQGERRRKAVCFRKSDHLEVSDQRCEHLPRPIAVTEACNTDCELRWELWDQHRQDINMYHHNKLFSAHNSKTFFNITYFSDGMSLERVSVQRNAALATAAWMFSCPVARGSLHAMSVVETLREEWLTNRTVLICPALQSSPPASAPVVSGMPESGLM
ncbi:hypothetical protein GOODEAATRI_023061 [Goodea atripinnis]|uniref:Uncharacterized protein n=1 Tax=Goodea atripinnis TaxID=208336 RepID=A0ABV0PQZ9_9TELE